MKTLIGVYHNSVREEFTVIVDLNEGDTIQTAFETAIEKLKHITADNVNSSDVSWYSAEMLRVNTTVTYTLVRLQKS